ncbi:alpha-L-arabinofuranosidase C-terminal domain-containing protein [Saccharicrinis sp. FJH62]|uniref:alpha-L-arabinofuranosidase C-terminal domain-containing protein n=1 Tax=Saccharicrinis sp. FJH62 TaxID=3344657 RepID=UPI0035D4A08C
MKNNVIILFLLLVISCTSKSQVTFEVDGNEQGKAISTNLIGAFFEDINYGADGGLYAELVQNRSFEYYPVAGYTDMQPLDAWSVITEGGAVATMTVENSNPINENNTHYLKFAVSNTGSSVGFKNSGYDGISVKERDNYDFSAYVRCDGSFSAPVSVLIVNGSGTAIGAFIISNITNDWQKVSGVITVTMTSDDATLQLKTKEAGTLYFDMISLFPQNTFKNRKNGLRQDLAQAVADLHPRFLRFPGGCVSHGRGNDNAYRWKETVGDVAERTPNWNLWGYHQTYGLGFFEYFQFCEDIGAIPFPVLPLGVSCQFRNREIVPMSEMQPWVDDALDLIEFANGDITTTWGKVRADMGHPEPFNMEYILLGNEEDDIPEFRERFLLIANAIREKHPEIKIIGTSGTDDTGSYYRSLWEFSRENNLDAVDEHYYNSPSWFLTNNHRYDDFPRTGPKVFIGEYASQGDQLYNAISEAAYLTGVERNADIIEFTCYAPLFCNENHNQWNPDLIRFDNNNLVKTASYYVQQLYSWNDGEEYIPSTLTVPENSAPFVGKIGVGSWNTQVVFDDVKVVSNGTVLLDENFSDGAANWTPFDGSFSVSSGTYVQSSGQTPAWSIANTVIDKSEYTFTLKAMKTGGAEGFLIPFALQDDRNYYWLNIGGWGNTQNAVEQASQGSKATLVSRGGSISNNRWYTIKIDVKGQSVDFYMDDNLLFSIPAPDGPVSASVVKNNQTNELIIKMVNSDPEPVTVNMKLKNVDTSVDAKVTTLTGPSSSSRNSLNSPDLIKPVESTVSVSGSFDYTLPPYSFQLFRVKLGNSTSLNDASRNSGSDLTIMPNPARESALICYNNTYGEPYKVYIYDTSGKMVYKNITKKSTTRVDKENMKSGVYYVKVNDKGKEFNGKLVINN